MAWLQSTSGGDRTRSPTVFEQQREELVREIAVVCGLFFNIEMELIWAGHGRGTSKHEPSKSKFGECYRGKY